MHRDELIWQYQQAFRLCSQVREKLREILHMAADLPDELVYQDHEYLKPQTYAVEFQQLLRYCLQAEIRYLTRRTEELANGMENRES